MHLLQYSLPTTAAVTVANVSVDLETVAAVFDPPAQIVVLENDSTDGTRAALEAWARRSDHVQIVGEPCACIGVACPLL